MQPQPTTHLRGAFLRPVLHIRTLDQDGLAARVEQVGVLLQVALLPAPVQLHRVEAVVQQRVNVALVALVRGAVVAALRVAGRGGGGIGIAGLGWM